MALKSTLFGILLLLCSVASGQRLGIAYYDVDKLYDTISSPFYDDTAYTPTGRLRWNTERYQHSITQIATVIDSMAMPITALFGVENSAVVKDITATSCQDYSYLHRTLNTLSGMDFALLYYGDRFFPDKTDSGLGWLRIDGTLDGTEVTIILCNHHARYIGEVLAECRECTPQRRLLVLGRIGALDPARYGLHDTQAKATSAGRGNAHYRSGWRMVDHILVDTAYQASGGDVYARWWLFNTQTGKPLPIFQKEGYRGGFSSKLPVFTYLFPFFAH